MSAAFVAGVKRNPIMTAIALVSGLIISTHEVASVHVGPAVQYVDPINLNRDMQTVEATSKGDNVACLVQRSSYAAMLYKSARVGDVVVYISPLNPSMHMYGRVIAKQRDRIAPLPAYFKSKLLGDTEVCRDALGEWIMSPVLRSRTVLVPDGNLWLEALDHSSSKLALDSNLFGPVTAGCLTGIVALSWNALTSTGLTQRQRDRVQIRGVPNIR